MSNDEAREPTTSGPGPAPRPEPDPLAWTAAEAPEEPWPTIPSGLETPPDTSHLLPAPLPVGNWGLEQQPSTPDEDVLALELAADAKRGKKARLVYQITLAAVTLFSSLGMGIGIASSGEVVLGIAMGLVFLVIFGAAMAAIAVGLNRQGKFNPMPNALASPGPNSFGRVYSSADPAAIREAIQTSVSMTGLLAEPIDPHRLQIHRPAGPQNRSFKLTVDIRPSTRRPGWQLVSVLARPSMALSYYDGGAGQRLADAVLRAVPGRDTTPPALDAFSSE